MTITEENLIRLLDLNKYHLNEEQTKDKELLEWTQEILYTFTSNSSKYSNFKNTVKKNVYKLPVGAKLSKYGARHFVMKEQCAMTDEEISKLREEAVNKYSPYWYGMISTCHFSGHITLKIAQMLFPLESWSIISTAGHTFVTNLTRNSIINIFSDISPFAKEVDKIYEDKYMEPGVSRPRFLSEEWRAEKKERIKEVSKLLNPYIVDKAEYKEASPMIIDLLATDKETFLGLVARASSKYLQSYTTAKAFRNSLVKTGNIRKVPLTMKVRNYFYKNSGAGGGAASGASGRSEGGRRKRRTRRRR
jgi:hypothetical protein